MWVLIIFFIFIFTFAYDGLRGAPWLPTHKHDVQRFLNLANIQPKQVVYDLGCGDGRLIFAAAKLGARVYGLELSLLPYVLANIRRLFQKNKHQIKILYKDLWNFNLKNADIVYIFLTPKNHTKIAKKLKKELKPGTKIITYAWPIKNWDPIKIDIQKGHPNMYLYKI